MRMRMMFAVVAVAFGALATHGFAQETAARAIGAPTGKLPSPAQREGPQKSTGPSVFGTTAVSYLTVGSSEFSPMDSSWTYSDDGVFASAVRRFSTVSGGIFVAAVHLPAGALLTYFEYDYCNTNPSVGSEAFLYASDYQGTINGVLGDLSVSGTGGCGHLSADLTGLAYTVDNYLARVIPVVRTDGGNNTTSFSGITIGYQLQVSPAPLTATFNDVSTGDFAFQYIEALYKSGITGGCGSNPPFSPPVYCPDAFVTRRQMGIFIAKALGLQWQ